MEIEIIKYILTTAIAVMGLFLSYKAGKLSEEKSKQEKANQDKEEAKEEAVSQAKISVKLDTICNTTNDIRADVRSINAQIQDINKVQIIQGEKIKEHEKRISQLEERVQNK